MSETASSPGVLEARGISVVLGGRQVLEIPSLQVLPNEVLVVVGPNGSGKTTLLLCLALLLKPAAGTIFYRQKPVDGSELMHLRRQFAVVFQEPLLLNSSVHDNVTLGLRLRGFKRAEIETRTRKWLERFGIASLENRQARTLSGGEARRVSLARAFALEPQVLFLDEPFTALDSPTRQSLIEDFESVLRETRVTTVMVTHDRNEAAVLASRLAVLIDGRIRQIGAPEEVSLYPVDEQVAGFIEAGNILHGVVTSQADGLATVAIGDRQLDAASDLARGTRVTLFLRHDDLTISPEPSPPSSARNHLAGTVVRLFPLGSQVRVSLDCGFPLVGLINRKSAAELGLAPGKLVYVSFKATAVRLLERYD